MKTVTLLLTIVSARAALLCDRTQHTTFYWLEGPEDCEEENGAPYTLNITTFHTSPYKVKGWVITLSELTCTTHYFFWGSYSSTHSLKPVRTTVADTDQPGCPEDYVTYKTEEELLKNCVWAWPKETTITVKVCAMTTGLLENSPSGYYIDGVRATCHKYTCTTDTGAIFVHTTSLDVLDSQASTSVIADDALCTPHYCIRPTTMTLYKAARVAPSLPGWEYSWESTTGELVHIKKRAPRQKRDTEEIESKIMYLEEEALRLGHQTKMLCHIIKQLRLLFWLASGPEPTILARNILDRPNIVAEVRGHLLLVWGCNTVDSCVPVPTKACYEHLPVNYTISERPGETHLGYLNTATDEIIKTSPTTVCKKYYLGDQNGALISVYNGSVTRINGSFPRLRLSPSSGNTSFNPPSWERDTTEASNHKTIPLTYSDLGDYHPEEETLGSMIHHLHNRELLPLAVAVVLFLLWVAIVAPIWRLKREVRDLRARQDGLLYALR